MDFHDHTDETGAEKARRPRGLLRRFARHDGGSAIVEFAALIVPFLLLVFAILESCISFAAQQMLANATDDVARQFRTGQIRASDLEKNKDRVKDFVCEKISMVVADGCPGLVVDLQTYDTFREAADSRIPFTDDGDLDLDSGNPSLALGGSGTKNQLRVFYRWPVMTDFMRKSMSSLPDGKTLLYAVVTWQNEPFDEEE